MNIIGCVSESQWLEERRKSIGGSDAPALFGLGYGASPLRVALEKLGKAPKRPQTEEMLLGQLQEPVIRTLYEQRTNTKVAYHGRFIIHRHNNGFMHCSLDGTIKGESDGVLQCKLSNEPPSEWEEGMPLRLAVEVQLQHEMFVTGLTWGAAAILVTHFRQQFIHFRVERNDAFCRKLEEKERVFWEEIHAGILPSPNADDHHLIRHLHPRDNGKSVILEDVRHVEDYEQWVTNEKARKEAEEKENLARNKLEMAIGDATRVVLANGVRLSLRATKDGRRVLKREWEKR